MTKLDVVRHSDRLKLLHAIDQSEIAEFNGEPYYAVPAISDILKISEMDIISKIKEHDNISVDLEFLESDSRHIIHDGESATGRPLVMGLSWRGLKMLCTEFDNEQVRALARDILIIEYVLTNPASLNYFYNRTQSKPIGLNRPVF